MKKLPIIIILITILAACSTNGSKNLSKGKEVYKTYCYSCHGENGDLGLNNAKNLTSSILSVEERILIIANGQKSKSGVMAAYKEILSKEEIEAVAKYTLTLKK